MMQTLELKSHAEWRAWLEENHARVDEIWLVYYKKTTGLPTLDYKDTLDEALCFGWVDSLIKKIDDRRYARKFTPRRDDSSWSRVNKERARQLIKEGRMTEHGRAKIEAARQSGSWDAPTSKPDLDFEMPEELLQALEEHPRAKAFFDSLAPSCRKQYITWIATAKRADTRQHRAAEAVRLLDEEKKLGLR
jgi:uncharacterized protein YdeI (YjbR/CyaY-like superfamily)